MPPRNSLTKRRKSAPQALAKRRGRSFEGKVAKLLGGHIHVGQDGDVVGPDGTRVEAKYRSGLNLIHNHELFDFLDQVNRYVTTKWGDDPWILAITGGMKAKFPKLSKSGVFVLMSMEQYLRMRDGGE